MKHDVSDIDYEIFHETVLSILNAHAPWSKSCYFRNKRTPKNSYGESKAKKSLLKKNKLKQLKQLTVISEMFVLVFFGTRKGLILKTLT